VHALDKRGAFAGHLVQAIACAAVGGVGAGFSGGEFKRAEVLQALLLKPAFVILDEPDSGLDIDGIAAVGNAITKLASSGSGVLLSTHYARVLRFIKPTRVYVMVDGRVALEGDETVIKRIEELGYQGYFKELQNFGELTSSK